MAKTLDQAEFEWLRKQTGVSSRWKNDMWTEVYTQQGVDDDLGWLKKQISDAGGTPKNTVFLPDLWAQLVTVLGFRVSKNFYENQLTFFLND